MTRSNKNNSQTDDWVTHSYHNKLSLAPSLEGFRRAVRREKEFLADLFLEAHRRGWIKEVFRLGHLDKKLERLDAYKAGQWSMVFMVHVAAEILAEEYPEVKTALGELIMSSDPEV